LNVYSNRGEIHPITNVGVMDVLFADDTDFDLWHPEPLGIEDGVVTENI